MANILGDAYWGFQPVGDATNMIGAFYDYRTNYLKSANDPLRYQVQWVKSGLTEATVPSKDNWSSPNGDLINVIFTVSTSVDDTNWTEIGVIKKSRDIANKKYTDDTVADNQRFTIDISQLVSDELSYSLCPINKGTWQSNKYGGMNGGLTMQDNVLGNTSQVGDVVSNYNVSKNGTYRRVKVVATFEVINGDGAIISSSETLTSTTLTVINSVNQFERDSLYYTDAFMCDIFSPSSSKTKRFLTRCPNWYHNDVANNVAYNKKVRMDESAEWLQWYVRRSYNGNDPTDFYNLIEIYGETFTADGTSQNAFVLVDFTKNLATQSATLFAHDQNTMLVQNVSPAFINNNAFVPQNDSSGGVPITAYSTSISPIDSSTHRYRLYYRGHYFSQATSSWTSKIHSSSNWYEIDREPEKIPYEFVRFHWLNSMGGTDSYTAKRDIVEGLTIGRDVIERKSGDRTWYQGNKDSAGAGVADTSYHSDTMRGGDIYKGGREVTNVNAERTQSVYTEPLNKDVAKWLEEIMLSPNVWIEMDTDATQMGNTRNPYLRPSDKEYIPVIITNSDIETVNQENGLVKFNIEYTLAHKVITQRN